MNIKKLKKISIQESKNDISHIKDYKKIDFFDKHSSLNLIKIINEKLLGKNRENCNNYENNCNLIEIFDQINFNENECFISLEKKITSHSELNKMIKNVSNFSINSQKNEDEIINFLENIKKEHKSLFSSNPTNRSEIILLQNSLKNQMYFLGENKKFSLKEKYILCDKLLQIYFNEIVRQISFTCFESGQLIMQIWQTFIKLIKKLYKFDYMDLFKSKTQEKDNFIKILAEKTSEIEKNLKIFKSKEIEIK